MSCVSPFVYSENATEYIITDNFSFPNESSSVIVEVPEICIPGYSECTWDACVTVPGYCIPAIPLFQGSVGLNISSLDMTFVQALSTQYTTTGVQEVEVSSVTVDSLNASAYISVDGGTLISYDLPMPGQISIVDANGNVSISVLLSSQQVDYDGGTFTFDLYLLFCLDPTPPSSWINLQLSGNATFGYDSASYTSSFSMIAPIYAITE